MTQLLPGVAFLFYPCPGVAATVFSAVSGEFGVNTVVVGRQSVPSGTSTGDGRFLVTWTSELDREKQHLALRTLVCGSSSGSDEVPIDASITDGDNAGGVLAADDRGSFIAWGENRLDPTVPGDLRDYSVVTQGLTSQGLPVSPPFRPLGFQLGNEFLPEVAATKSGDFAVVWTDYNSEPGEPENASRIRWQLVDRKASHPGNVVDVAPYSAQGLPINPDIASLSDDQIVVVWQELARDGSGDGVLLRRFDPSGAPAADEVIVSTTTLNNQQRPKVAAGPSGLMIVIWQSEGQDGDGSGIFGQILSAAGQKIGAEFQINQYSAHAQQYPAVATIPLGFLVTWESLGQDGEGFGGFARAFSWARLPLGDEFQLNTTSAGDQREQQVIADGRGNILALWTSQQDGDRTGLVGRYFRIEAPLCGDRATSPGCRRLTTSDALAVLRGAVFNDACSLCMCDTDDSGDVTAADSLRVLRSAVGLAVAMTCPSCDQ